MSSAIGQAPAIGSKGVRHFAGSFVVAVHRLAAFRRISASHGGSHAECRGDQHSPEIGMVGQRKIGRIPRLDRIRPVEKKPEQRDRTSHSLHTGR
jgi:hypothetical protein